MKRVLFVDDEVQILNGLKRMLHGQRGAWEMDFVTSGELALERMAAEPFDVVISDMRMPIMDGSQLLHEVQRRYPESVRIVLSGHTELEAALRSVPVAHQFLTKPCESHVLRDVVERACRLHELLLSEELRQRIGGIGALPARPAVYSRLVAAAADPEVSMDEVGAIVEQDMAVTAKVLQLVNSSFFGIARRVTNVREGVRYVGLHLLKNLTLCVEVFEGFTDKVAGGYSLDGEQELALMVARVARRMVSDRSRADDAFLAGMLHDVGQLVLATRMPEQYGDVLRGFHGDQLALMERERQVLGCTHPEVGAYLLGLWGMPYPVVEAVAYHHRPHEVGPTSIDLLGAVHLSDCMCRELLRGDPDDLDREWLDSVGLDEALLDLRSLAEEEVRECKAA